MLLSAYYVFGLALGVVTGQQPASPAPGLVSQRGRRVLPASGR